MKVFSELKLEVGVYRKKIEKYRLVYRINVREWPEYTFTAQKISRLTKNGLKQCNFRMHLTDYLSIITH